MRMPRSSLVYLDENGSFVRRQGDVSGIAALLCPGKPPWIKLEELVSSIESDAGADERNKKGEVKGAKLRPNRFAGLIEFLSSERFLLFQLIAKEDRVPNLEAETRKRHSASDAFLTKASEIDRETDGAESQAALKSITNVEFAIASAIQSVFGHGVVQELASKGLPAEIGIVYDPRSCSSGFKRVLKTSVSMAFTTQLARSMSRPVSATLGDPESPWTVREAIDADHAGLMLVDWVAYPKFAMERDDLPPAMRENYRKVVQSFEKAAVIRYPKFPLSGGR